MNGGVAQLVALAAYGNWAVHAPHEGIDLAQNSAFRYVRDLSFTRRRFIGFHRHSETVALSVAEWYGALRAQGVVRLALSRTPTTFWSLLDSYQWAAFVAREQAVIVTVRPGGGRELWTPDWQVVDGLAPDRRIWAVSYRGSRRPLLFKRLTGRNPAAAAATLDTVLRKITEFASLNGMGDWVPWFERAARLLRGDEPEPPYHPDLLPPVGYSPEVRRLLNACIGGWVFGGMGSWNDSLPGSRAALPRYEALSKQLYDAIMNGVVTATNAFEAPVESA